MTPHEIAKAAVLKWIDVEHQYIHEYYEFDRDVDGEVFDKLWDETEEALFNILVNVRHKVANG